VRNRAVDTRDKRTAQETHVARLASEGHTIAEIGAQHVINPKTVEHHLRKVFAKLGISSRRELRGPLLNPGRPASPA
jgi:DNA-binding CsgD family transcriptional regulator